MSNVYDEVFVLTEDELIEWMQCYSMNNTGLGDFLDFILMDTFDSTSPLEGFMRMITLENCGSNYDSEVTDDIDFGYEWSVDIGYQMGGRISHHRSTPLYYHTDHIHVFSSWIDFEVARYVFMHENDQDMCDEEFNDIIDEVCCSDDFIKVFSDEQNKLYNLYSGVLNNAILSFFVPIVADIQKYSDDIYFTATFAINDELDVMYYNIRDGEYIYD